MQARRFSLRDLNPFGNGTRPVSDPKRSKPAVGPKGPTDRMDRSSSRPKPTPVGPKVAPTSPQAGQVPKVSTTAFVIGGALVGAAVAVPIASMVLGTSLSVFAIGSSVAGALGGLAQGALGSASAGTQAAKAIQEAAALAEGLQAAEATAAAATEAALQAAGNAVNAASRGAELASQSTQVLGWTSRLAIGTACAGGAIMLGGTLTGAALGYWLAPTGQQLIANATTLIDSSTQAVNKVIHVAKNVANAAGDATNNAREWINRSHSSQWVAIGACVATVYVGTELAKAHMQNRSYMMGGMPGMGAMPGMPAQGQPPFAGNMPYHL